MSKVLMAMLDQARGLAGVPFVINSAWRCYDHNEAVGGKETSAHLFGYAVDISCTASRNRYKIIKALITAGFSRIGISKSFIHVDIDGTKDAEVAWLY
jgi:uncharacterized protein YcbK (DUF882 family)